MQQFHKFITWRLCVAQHVSGLPRPSSGAQNCTRSLWFSRWTEAAGALLVVVCQTTTKNAPAAAVQRLNQRLLVQLYAPDDGREDARNMLSHT